MLFAVDGLSICDTRIRTTKRQLIITRNIAPNVPRALLLLFFSFFLVGPRALFAETISVSLTDLQSALDSAAETRDPVTRGVMDKISAAIADADLSFSDGELIYELVEENITVEGGCNRTEILSLHTEVTLGGETSLSFTLDSLYDPIVVSADVVAQLSGSGEARQILGIRLGECQNLARDTFRFNASGPATFSLSVSMLLNPEWVNETTLRLRPEVELTGNILEISPSVTVNDTVLKQVLEDYLTDRLEDLFSNSRLSEELVNLEVDLNKTLSESFDNGQIDIELPEPTNDQLLALYALLQPDSRFPITLDLLHEHKQELLASLLFGEPESVQGIFADAALCEAASSFLLPAAHAPLYNKAGQQCLALPVPLNFDAAAWADSDCNDEIDFQYMSVAEYCNTALDPARLGNAAASPDGLGKWTHSPGSRFDIAALSLATQQQPIMRRFVYKTEQTARGQCSLEMRVYAGSASARDQKPLLALHGGSWQHRASGFIGIETMATHFTNQGFMVFAPAYRLVGESDGPTACNNASLNDLILDVSDALNWIYDNEKELAIDGKVTLFGQSAGGHLALSLLSNRPDEISRAVLFYAPTDFADFAQQMLSGSYTNNTGKKILETITGDSLENLDLNSELVLANSFPPIIALRPKQYPPVFMLHGEMDSLLPFRQSVRLCNAYAGSDDLNNGIASNTPSLTGYATEIACGAGGSQLHLIAEGEHALDLCLAPGLCLSGSADSSVAVGRSISSMLEWASSPLPSSDVTATGMRSSGGFGSLSFFSLSILLLVLFRQFYILWFNRFNRVNNHRYSQNRKPLPYCHSSANR